jgi:tetratricopeptide (TPR) repeat protein
MLGFESTLDEAFRDGVELARDGQFERADALLRQCVMGDPANSRFVVAYLENLSLKNPPTPNTASPSELPAPLANACRQQNWNEVWQRGPEQLSLTPWHVPTLLAMADAYEAEELPSEAAAYLQQALLVAPHDAAVNRRAAVIFTRLGRIDDALASWQRVELADANDHEAARRFAQLVITQSRQQAGLAPPTTSATSSVPSKIIAGSEASHRQSSFTAEANSSELNLTPIQRLEAAIRERPADPHLYEELTRLYLEKDRDYDAERMLAKAKTATDNDPAVLQLWEDVTLLRLDKKIAQARKRLEVEPSDESRIALAALQEERDEVEVKIFGQRCQRQPQNADLHFQLGLRLKRAGRESEASQHFQAALSQGQIACASAYELAQCCERFGQFDQAMRYYRLTANACHEPSDQPRQADALYRASAIALRLQLFSLARRYLAELLAAAPDHREGLALRREIDHQFAQYATA